MLKLMVMKIKMIVINNSNVWRYALAASTAEFARIDIILGRYVVEASLPYHTPAVFITKLRGSFAEESCVLVAALMPDQPCVHIQKTLLDTTARRSNLCIGFQPTGHWGSCRGPFAPPPLLPMIWGNKGGILMWGTLWCCPCPGSVFTNGVSAAWRLALLARVLHHFAANSPSWRSWAICSISGQEGWPSLALNLRPLGSSAPP